MAYRSWCVADIIVASVIPVFDGEMAFSVLGFFKSFTHLLHTFFYAIMSTGVVVLFAEISWPKWL